MTFLDPDVERRKFDREVERLMKHQASLAKLGIWVARIERPVIDVIVMPKHCARLGLPTVSSRPIVLPGQQIEIKVVDLPNLSARPIGVRLDLTGYDQQPPSVAFHDPWTWQPAAYASIPLGHLTAAAGQPGMLVVLDTHPETRKPFLCMRGVREYHKHPQHDGDDWDMYRGYINVFWLLEQLARCLVEGARATLLFQIGPHLRSGQTQVNLNITWGVQ